MISLNFITDDDDDDDEPTILQIGNEDVEYGHIVSIEMYNNNKTYNKINLTCEETEALVCTLLTILSQE